MTHTNENSNPKVPTPDEVSAKPDQSKPPSSWAMDRDEDGIAWLGIDKPDTQANVLSSRVMAELDEILAQLEADTPRALVVYSAKASGFIAGADISEFIQIRTPEEGYTLIRAGQEILDRLAALSFPTVAMINGFAMGGGLELALACDYRVITDGKKTQLSLPEVRLGIHPGFGGTVRAVRLIGVLLAMDMMLTGRSYRPAKALSAGLVDRVVSADELRAAARALALDPPPRKKPGLKDWAMSLPILRSIVARQMTRQVAAKAPKAHYPAPYAIIDLWLEYRARGRRAYEAEARSIAELMCTETSRNLVRVFFLQTRLKSLGANTPTEIKHVHVVGAGVMGGDIAAWCALRGLQVSLQDREKKYVEPALSRAQQLFEKKLRDPLEIQEACTRLQEDVAGDQVAQADVVIEAIFENAEAKQALYRDLEPKMKKDAVLASNTSSIMLEKLNGELADPQRFIGLHFFNPVAKMPLVEVVHTDETPDASLARGLAFAKRIDRLPLPCRSAPGFVVNRILAPYMMEAGLIAEDGVPYAAIDKAAVTFGMPMGPIELADTVGLDVSLHVAEILSDKLDIPEPKRMRSLVDAGHLGRKSGRGFYEYRDGKAVKEHPRDYQPPEDVTDRMMLALINQCVAVLREGIVDDADLLDAGVIFATGFAPFRGGPIQYAKSRGIDRTIEALEILRQRYGERFSPDPGWEKLREELAASPATAKHKN